VPFFCTGSPRSIWPHVLSPRDPGPFIFAAASMIVQPFFWRSARTAEGLIRLADRLLKNLFRT